MNNCLVSIVTISRNNLVGLSETLRSVKEQDYETIQHIIIDGDSSDGTKEFLQSYQHSKIFTYVSEKDNGISSAFNKGIDRSVGNLIFFLNSGDVLTSEKVISEVVASYLENKWQFAVGSIVSSDYTFKEVLYNPPKLSAKFLSYFMFLPHQAVFCETSLHNHYKFDESIKTSMDYDVFLRMLKGIKIFYLPIIVAKFQPGGISSQSQKRISEQSNIRLKYANNNGDKLIISMVNKLIMLKDLLKINSPFIVSKYKDENL
ncbi:glycosyltransferase family 2 protein [Dolichospermum lemmermannii CS-548]|uniref:glycosyltransferase family 2 protein n=1 Tax=Dolichospermum lemmermannii TaxID=54295 RepID=UPI00232CF1D4|nr:glycosyltransferase family 2 protein [Dolichospermum lemmermannii]MDB9436435.1 glycosyltransferase family 2 protein [Dolichospermum lemmermannii CS-548]